MLREDEGRKLVKPLMIAKLTRVMETMRTQGYVDLRSKVERNMIHTLIQKVRYKKYILTKEDMMFVNDMFSKWKGFK